jgi:carbamoyl-phosphate synthase large subunit
MDMDNFNAGRYLSDKFYQIPAATADNYIETVLDICKKEKIDIFIPIIDLGFLKLSELKVEFEKIGVFLLLSGLDVIKITEDKLQTFKFFKNHKIPTPVVYDFNNSNLKFPLFVKPRTGGRASINSFKVENYEELKFYLQKIPNLLIQEYIEGEEFTADCLNSLDGKEFIESVIRKRIETKGGLSVKSVILEKTIAERIKNYIKNFSQIIKIIGAYNVQGFITNDNKIYFTEINPRFAGTHSFTIEAGMNSIEYILDMRNGENIKDIKNNIRINYGLKMIRYWEEIFINENKIYNPWNLWN